MFQILSGERELVVIGQASTAQGTQLPVRKLGGASPFQGLRGGAFALADMFFDQSPPGAPGANDAALVLVDRRGGVATFASNGSRTGVLGDIPPTTLATSRGLNLGAAVYDPLANRIELGKDANLLTPDSDLLFFDAGSTSVTPNRTVTVPVGVEGGQALDRTR